MRLKYNVGQREEGKRKENLCSAQRLYKISVFIQETCSCRNTEIIVFCFSAKNQLLLVGGLGGGLIGSMLGMVSD